MERNTTEAASNAPRKIIHSDCDCFYAAIETRDSPSLRGKPIAVGGRPDQRGVVASCNYEARALGIHSAMPMANAMRRCPDLIVIRPAMEKYRLASRLILAIYRMYSDLVEPLSLDEAFIDVSQSPHCKGSATLIAREIKARVRREVGIAVSTGVAGNKFLAKIASAWQKPDGLFVIEPHDVDRFVAVLPVEKLYGVGAVTAAKLRNHGLSTCADIRARSRLELRSLVGMLGDRLYELSRGIDLRAVTPTRPRKSLSVEETYVRDLKDLATCRSELEILVGRLAEAARKLESNETIERVFVKIRFDDFRRTSVERSGHEIDAKHFLDLLEEGFARIGRPVRLLGVGARITEAHPENQFLLFEPDPTAPISVDPG